MKALGFVLAILVGALCLLGGNEAQGQYAGAIFRGASAKEYLIPSGNDNHQRFSSSVVLFIILIMDEQNGNNTGCPIVLLTSAWNSLSQPSLFFGSSAFDIGSEFTNQPTLLLLSDLIQL